MNITKMKPIRKKKRDIKTIYRVKWKKTFIFYD